jgi:mannose-6-phosphate isomerase-like protein (cupin superfamily)
MPIVHDLSPDSVRGMVRAELAKLDRPPESPIGEFAFGECTGGIGAFVGRPPWERHNGGDELLLVLSGSTQLTVLEDSGPRSQIVEAGGLVVVPRGRWHNNNAPDGVTMLHVTPTEGNEHSWEDPAP